MTRGKSNVRAVSKPQENSVSIRRVQNGYVVNASSDRDYVGKTYIARTKAEAKKLAAGKLK